MPDRLELLTRAAAEALSLRGTVTLAVPGSEDKWCAIRASAQGHIELRVGEPSGLRRLLEEGWLARHGFTRVAGAWARPLAPGTGAAEAAAILAATLRRAPRIRPAETLLRSVQPGAPGGVVPPAAESKRPAHVAAALTWLLRARRGIATVELGRPARPAARAFVDDGSLVVAVPSPLGTAAAETELGRFPLSADGVREAADGLSEQLLRDFGSADEDPLYIGLIGVSDPVRAGAA
jgi:hypothetical protein